MFTKFRRQLKAITLLIFTGLMVTNITSCGKTDTSVNSENLSKLIEKEYSVGTIKDDDKTSTISVIGDLSFEDSKKLGKEVFTKFKESKKDSINLTLFKTTEKDVDFYDKDLIADIKVDFKNTKLTISNFSQIKDAKKAKLEDIKDVKTPKVTKSENKTSISIDFNLDKLNDTQIFEQAVAYLNTIKTLNKDIKNLELNINTSLDKSYAINSNHSDILKASHSESLK